MDVGVMTAMFETSRDERRGLTVFLQNHRIPIVVEKIHGTSCIEGANQEFGSVLIRTDQIVALGFQ